MCRCKATIAGTWDSAGGGGWGHTPDRHSDNVYIDLEEVESYEAETEGVLSGSRYVVMGLIITS